jgi:hypothetical protein
VLEGGRFATQARKHRLAATGNLLGIIKWCQGVQASAASHTERGGGTGGSESKREGGMCRVGGGKVCHHRSQSLLSSSVTLAFRRCSVAGPGQAKTLDGLMDWLEERAWK